MAVSPPPGASPLPTLHKYTLLIALPYGRLCIALCIGCTPRLDPSVCKTVLRLYMTLTPRGARIGFGCEFPVWTPSLHVGAHGGSGGGGSVDGSGSSHTPAPPPPALPQSLGATCLPACVRVPLIAQGRAAGRVLAGVQAVATGRGWLPHRPGEWWLPDRGSSPAALVVVSKRNLTVTRPPASLRGPPPGYHLTTSPRPSPRPTRR